MNLKVVSNILDYFNYFYDIFEKYYDWYDDILYSQSFFKYNIEDFYNTYNQNENNEYYEYIQNNDDKYF